MNQTLLVELFTEELPPKALAKLGEAFAAGIVNGLKSRDFLEADSVATSFASPRRLAAHVTQVATQAADKAIQQKLMPVAVGLDANGNASPALLKKLQALGADVSNPAAVVASLKRAPDGKAEALFYDSVAKGASLLQGLQKAAGVRQMPGSTEQDTALENRAQIRLQRLYLITLQHVQQHA